MGFAEENCKQTLVFGLRDLGARNFDSDPLRTNQGAACNYATKILNFWTPLSELLPIQNKGYLYEA